MYIQAPLKSGKTAYLAEKFAELLASGVKSSEILVIVQNSYKKKVFLELLNHKLKEKKIFGTSELNVHTFNGIVFNSIKRNWAIVEEILPEVYGKKEILPNLCGLDVSELIIKKCIKKINSKEKLEDSLRDYRSHRNLKHQLLRRLSLITNNLLDKDEIEDRSAVLNEQMGKQAQETINEYKKLSNKYRTFDNLKQISTFFHLLERGKIDFKEINYIFVDDYDELAYSAQQFVKLIIRDVKSFYIAADTEGSTRRGYLCANPQGFEEIKEFIPSEILELQCKNEIYNDANQLFKAILENKSANFKNIKLIENSIRYVEMLEQIFTKISFLLKNKKYSPNDLAIIAPYVDDTLKHTLKEFFEKENIPYQLLTGSKKIFDNILVFGTVIILQLINQEWQFEPKKFEIRSLLTGMMGLSTVDMFEIMECYAEKHFLPDNAFLNKEMPQKYTVLVALIKDLKENKKKLSIQVERIFTEIILPELDENADLEDFNRMLKSLIEFEKLMETTKDKVFSIKDWIILIKDTVVSDNPSSAPDLKENTLKIATPQKLIDLEVSSKIQIWLDISSNNWLREDTGTLYNSWVFNKNWCDTKYTPQIHRKLTLQKTAHVLRKLALLSQQEIWLYASQLDLAGNENEGGIEEYICEEKSVTEINFNFIPREDQREVLNYESGTMAISAVPGAGKTKILEALIIKLIKEGVNPESILVLTYMESAARNIRERIKTSCPNLLKFPAISTIHGLGLSIIKNGDNYSKVGLDADFEICDDTLKFKIMRDVFETLIKTEDLKQNLFNFDYPSAISQAKFLKITPEKIAQFLHNKKREDFGELYDFYPVYSLYQEILKDRNIVDFDDLLVLSVDLVKNFPEIREHFQDKFAYIIEDEAQDSSEVQQELFKILSEKHGNLIRCGDPNQAITSSFSNSDVRGFVDFIDNAEKIVCMDHSQRCADEVFYLANSLVDYAKEEAASENAFVKMKIHPVKGKNPDTKDCLHFDIYETPEEEKLKVFEEVQKLRKSGYKFSIGILLRSNPSVIEWAEFLDAREVPYICYSESVAQKKVFRFIKSLLEVLNNPWDNQLVKSLYEEFVKIGAIPYEFDCLHFIEKSGSPFVTFSREELSPENLRFFQDEIMKWLAKSYLSPEEIITDLATAYFTNVIDKSNARIIGLLVSRFRRYDTDNEINKSVNLPEIIDYLRELGYKKSLNGVKFFNEIESDSDKSEFVQIMTVHKAKGLEFDAVFMPEMQEAKNGFPISSHLIRIGTRERLINQLKLIINNNIPFDELKKEIINEHLRLIYVGITRAIHYLYMSGNKKSKYSWEKKENYSPSKVLEYFMKNRERIVNNG